MAIQTATGEQFMVIADFSQNAIVQDQNLVCVLDG
jgi:hypothetical protein